MMQSFRSLMSVVVLIFAIPLAACLSFENEPASAPREVSLDMRFYCFNPSVLQRDRDLSSERIKRIQSIHDVLESRVVRRSIVFSHVYRATVDGSRYAYFDLTDVSDVAVAYEIDEHGGPLHGFYVTMWGRVGRRKDVRGPC